MNAKESHLTDDDLIFLRSVADDANTGGTYSNFCVMLDHARSIPTFAEVLTKAAEQIRASDLPTSTAKLQALIDGGLLPPSDALFNGIVPHPAIFRQHDQVFVKGINLPISGHPEPFVWWQHVVDVRLKAAFDEWIKLVANISSHPMTFTFCQTSAVAPTAETDEFDNRLRTAANYTN